MINDVIDKLYTYTDLENDDFSLACDALICIHGHRSILSKHLIQAIESELSDNLIWYQENTVVLSRTETPEPYEVQYLEMKEDCVDLIDDQSSIVDGMLEHYQVPPIDIPTLERNDRMLDGIALKYNLSDPLCYSDIHKREDEVPADSLENFNIHIGTPFVLSEIINDPNGLYIDGDIPVTKMDTDIEEVRMIMQNMNESPELHKLASEEDWLNLVEKCQNGDIQTADTAMENTLISVEKFIKRMADWSDEDTKEHPDDHKTTAECLDDFMNCFKAMKRKKD